MEHFGNDDTKQKNNDQIYLSNLTIIIQHKNRALLIHALRYNTQTNAIFAKQSIMLITTKTNSVIDHLDQQKHELPHADSTLRADTFLLGIDLYKVSQLNSFSTPKWPNTRLLSFCCYTIFCSPLFCPLSDIRISIFQSNIQFSAPFGFGRKRKRYLTRSKVLRKA